MPSIFESADDDFLLATEPATLLPDEPGGRWLRRHLAGSVVAVTTVTPGGFRAVAATACMVASIEPLLLLMSIELDSQMDGWLRESGIFAVNVLSRLQQDLADRFAGFTPLAAPDFRGIDHRTAVTGAPVLPAAIAWADCVVVDSLVTGDHRCFIGRVERLDRGTGNPEDPLVYYLNRYRAVE